MENAIISITSRAIGGGFIQTVNARELHGFLEVGKDFSTWVKAQIERARLVEGRDFVKEINIPQKGEQENQRLSGKEKVDYHLTLDAAKHIGMMSGTEKGYQVRDYFLECERRAKAPVDPLKALGDPASLRAILLTYTEKVLALEGKVAEMKPSVAAFKRLGDAKGSMCVTDAAKSLKIRPKELFAWLERHKWIYKRPNCSNWIGNQEKINAGLIQHTVVSIQLEEGWDKQKTQVKITARGVTRISELIELEKLSSDQKGFDFDE